MNYIKFFSILLLINQTNFLNAFGVNFDNGMYPNQHYAQKKDVMLQDYYWQKIKTNYEKCIIKKEFNSEKLLIPKIIHQIWIGSPHPEHLKKFQQSWIIKNPDWLYILWTDETIEKLNLQNKKLYDSIANYGSKSDVARYEILYRFGGLYIDTDFECLQPFDIIHYLCDFYASGLLGEKVSIYNGLIGTRPGHPVLKDCIEKLALNGSHNETFIDILYKTGPYFFTGYVKDHLPSNDTLVIFPPSYFYPWPNTDRDNNSTDAIAKWLRPESLAVHYWHVSWNNGIAKNKLK